MDGRFKFFQAGYRRWRRPTPQGLIQQFGFQGVAQIDLSLHDRPYRFDHNLHRAVLSHVSPGAEPDHSFGVEFLVMHGHHQDRQSRMSRVESPDQIEAALVLKRQVDDHYIRPGPADDVEGGLRILRFPRNRPARFPFNCVPEPHPRDRVVVDDGDSELLVSGHTPFPRPLGPDIGSIPARLKQWRVIYIYLYVYII
ncbi:MAG: hypothetical protein A3G34_11545 [Candidatus Lindowbacteria bacterium RIFCSPLOWO2_12_FULL_62_27]|nr:MAG: hypothetical protein A3G34_11545 [Candidatus Lindowbacteria bacterium RIFCSPLOWO2_12_FULL_62_27]